jgi:hypothetical protein
MAETLTANFGWTMPDPGASANTWGATLNKTTQAIDAQVYEAARVVTAPNSITLNTAPGPATNLITGQAAGTTRWVVYLGDGEAETGSNAGSNFAIQAFDDTGAFLDQPFEINRATSAVSMTGNVSMGNVSMAGAVSMASTVSMAGNVSMASNVSMAGAATLQAASVTAAPVNPNDVVRYTDLSSALTNPKFGSGTALDPSQAVLTVDNPYAVAAQFMNSDNRAAQISVIIRNDRVDGFALAFCHGASYTVAGSISNLGSSVVYNTTSDYRVKITYGAASGVGELIDGVPVHDAAFTITPDDRRPMFLAHELQEMCPWAVTGEKDGAAMQQVSLADLVPVLWAEVQNLRRRIAVLEGGRN